MIFVKEISKVSISVFPELPIYSSLEFNMQDFQQGCENDCISIFKTIYPWKFDAIETDASSMQFNSIDLLTYMILYRLQ